MATESSTKHYKEDRPCWSCVHFGGPQSHGWAANCLHPGCSPSRANPQYGCSQWSPSSKPPLRLIVCGDTDYADRTTLFMALDHVLARRRIVMLILGCEPGADRLADEWAAIRLVNRKSCPTLRGGGIPRRNSYMLSSCQPQGVVAFGQGSDVIDMITKAKAMGLPIWRPRPAPPSGTNSYVGPSY